MLLGAPKIQDASLYTLRRKDLIGMIKQEHQEVKNGAIVLIGAFENNRYRFRQESSFYYLTGITEPGAVAVIDLNGIATLYIPEHGDSRGAWVYTPVPLVQANAKALGFDYIKPLGQMAPGYQFHPLSDKSHYSTMSADLLKIISAQGTLFTLLADNAHEYIDQRCMVARFDSFIPGFLNACVNIADLVALMRRKKDMREIEQLYKAVEITILAQGAAAQAIAEGTTECEVQASLEYMFTGSCAQPAFPSIVASGKNATILHYTSNDATLKNGQLVVVDIGAEVEYYCADITRTYPVSGSFTKRQKELYNLVLETQNYIANRAKPGMWLSNKEKPDYSLHHLAKKFLDERGYGKYFIHGIGHFLGIDVHDVGNVQEPLQDGDVFTIEPGIYIPEENIGIRIEDDYWMAKDGVICLSEALPKKAEDIETIMQESLEAALEQGSHEEDEDLFDEDELMDDESDDEITLAHS